MSDQARERVQALGNQISPSSAGSSSNDAAADDTLPPIQKVAGRSAGPRVEGKVVIITGTFGHSRSYACTCLSGGRAFATCLGFIHCLPSSRAC